MSYKPDRRSAINFDNKLYNGKLDKFYISRVNILRSDLTMESLVDSSLTEIDERQTISISWEIGLKTLAINGNKLSKLTVKI